MEFWKLFITSLMPVVKVLLVTAVGAFVALDRFDILGENSRKNMNTIVFFVFTPALLLGNLAKSLTLRSIVMLWFMPINVLLTFIIGTALGWLLNKIARTPLHLQGLVLGFCSAGNLGNLPLIIVPALCKESNGAFGAVDFCNTNGMAYVSLSMAMGSIYIWSYVYNIVRIYTCKANSSNLSKDESSAVISVSATETDPENLSKCSTGQLVTVENSSQENGHTGQLEIECTNGEAKVVVPKQAKILKLFKTLAGNINLKALLPPATIGSIIGLIIGVVPPFRKAFIGESAPLRVVEDSVSMVGDAAIPTVTLLVGANLLSDVNGSSLQLPIIIGIIVVRYVALPVLGVGILKGAMRMGLIHSNPLYRFILLLQYALPPAISISTITQLFGAGVGECSAVMLATYACASVSLTLWSTFFMWLVL
ncbi:protein PIN-LIKES 3-like [Senna tora]|uniref:Protein PIN-LIKES 3-like n=1 Tax=Senna tora TaxID=362788 RepID=A0A834X394_9FABA|nr:protein PIN-LIKES 3-like [Senna tora]